MSANTSAASTLESKRHIPCATGGGEYDDAICFGAAEVDREWKVPDALRLRQSCSLLGMIEEWQSESASGLAEDGRKQSREESGWGGARGGRVTVEDVSELVVTPRNQWKLSWVD